MYMICYLSAHSWCPVASSNISYFSATRLTALARRLRHNRVDALIEKIEQEVISRRGQVAKDASIAECWRKPSELPTVSPADAQRYITG
jgi:hypothetical protein